MRLPNHRWQIYPAQAECVTQLAQTTQLSPVVSQLLVNRGIETLEQAQEFLDPELQILPSPLEEFADLAISLELLALAITKGQKVAICGDYDADGMTSTALLLRAFRWLGADIDYAIPSRMKDGYGINVRIVEEFYREGVQLILTVDNGISAIEPIARAKQLGLKVIVTDHHELPPKLPDADAILNPKLIATSSLYSSLAGVGVAYILAVSLAQQLGQAQGIVKPLLELFTLGTIADLAPLTGVNRRWVKRGLRQLPQSQLAGVQALIQVAGVSGREQGEQGRQGEQGEQSKIQNPKSLKPEDIGFRLGPQINAVGRIDDPQIVIELLTTDDWGIALERAKQCKEINQRRQQLCEQIEREAIAWVEQSQIDLEQERVLVIVQPNWHHGVIGIVASRLVERYGVPVFIGTYEDEHLIRGSARGIPEFHVFEALEFCREILGKFGGHKAAAGFSLPAANLAALQSRLSTFAHQCLELEHLKPLLKIDAQANFNQINQQLYTQVDALHPCGIENPEPIFWTPNVEVVKQQIVGKDHLKLTLQDIKVQPFKLSSSPELLEVKRSCKLKAIAWRWREYLPLPPQVDIAYRLRENIWNGNVTIELELVGVRLPSQRGQGEADSLFGGSLQENVGDKAKPTRSLEASSRRTSETKGTRGPHEVEIRGEGEKGALTEVPVPWRGQLLPSLSTCSKAIFCYRQRQYICGIFEVDSLLELRIKNSEGKVLALKLGQTTGLLGSKREEAIEVDLAKPNFCHLIQTALSALGIAKPYS